jgi:hypothetical protein
MRRRPRIFHPPERRQSILGNKDPHCKGNQGSEEENAFHS